MKLKRAMILFGTVCMLNIIVIGCGSGTESSANTDSRQKTDQEETADAKTTKTETETETNDMETLKPEITEADGKASLDDEKIPEGDPIAGIVEAYEGNTITVRTPEDDMLYHFATENVPILEGFSTENAQAVEGDFQIAVGDKVEVSYRGLLDDEKHPIEAVKIVVILIE